MASDSGLSSPDPIALSPLTPRSRQRTPQVNRSVLMERAANRTPRRASNYSPTKSIAFETPGSTGCSPWKIKVTVEAEPRFSDSDLENQSPSRGAQIRSQSTRIPLKDADGTSTRKNGRGRRSSATTPTSKPKKRSGTPVRRRRSTSAKAQAEDDDWGQPFNTSSVGLPKTPTRTAKRKGTPKKATPKHRISDIQLMEQDESDDIAVDATAQEVSQETATAPKNTSPAQHAMDEEASMILEEIPDVAEPLRQPAYADGPVVEPPEVIPGDGADDLGHVSEIGTVEDDTIAHSEGFSFVSAPSLKELATYPSTSASDLSQSIQPSQEDVSSNSKSGGKIFTTPAKKLREVRLPPSVPDTIPDFSTLKSTPATGWPDQGRTQQDLEIPCEDVFKIPEPSFQEVFYPSILLPSSPPIPAPSSDSSRKITPANKMTLHPQLPPAPVSLVTRESMTTPELAKAVKTSYALQGVLEQDSEDHNHTNPLPSSPRDGLNIDDVFISDSDDARHKLQLNTRLGKDIMEDLKDRPSQFATSSSEALHHNGHTMSLDLQNHRLPTPAETDRSRQASPTLPPYQTIVYPALPRSEGIRPTPPSENFDKPGGSSPEDKVTLDVYTEEEEVGPLSPPKDLESYMERGREDVRKQAEQASASQIIVIDSDSEEDVGDDGEGSLPASTEDETLDQTISSEDADDTGSFFQNNLPAVFNTRQPEPMQWHGDLSKFLSRHRRQFKNRNPMVTPSQTDIWVSEASHTSSPTRTQSNGKEQPGVEQDEGDFSDTTPLDLAEGEEPVRNESTQMTSSISLDDEQSSHDELYGEVIEATGENDDEKSLSSYTEEQSDEWDDDLGPPDNMSTPYPDHKRIHSQETATYIRSNAVYTENRSAPTIAMHEPASEQVSPAIVQFEKHSSPVAASEESASEQMPPTTVQLEDYTSPTELEDGPSSETDAGLFSRLTSYFWSTLTWPVSKQPAQSPAPLPAPAQQIQQQPTAKPTLPARTSALRTKYGLLSNSHPWSLSHYRTLDRMYQRNKLTPSYFSTFPLKPSSPPHPLTPEFVALVGHTISNCGYSVTFDLSDVYIIATFLELLVDPGELSDEEREAQLKTPRLGNDPGKVGQVIGRDIVARRLFTLVMGEQMREEERLGLRGPPSWLDEREE
ncbi:MAG: hypothetical protein M1820_009662 [Bogoriella megaspora]|nr:MAG: hypothetical protein M1820_009662 [Bogoriella megaspora]